MSIRERQRICRPKRALPQTTGNLFPLNGLGLIAIEAPGPAGETRVGIIALQPVTAAPGIRNLGLRLRLSIEEMHEEPVRPLFWPVILPDVDQPLRCRNVLRIKRE